MFGQLTQNFPVFGDMQYKSYWIGEMEIPAFSAQAEVIVRAKKEGITQAQIQAMQDFLVHQQKIQQQAVNELVEFLLVDRQDLANHFEFAFLLTRLCRQSLEFGHIPHAEHQFFTHIVFIADG